MSISIDDAISNGIDLVFVKGPNRQLGLLRMVVATRQRRWRSRRSPTSKSVYRGRIAPAAELSRRDLFMANGAAQRQRNTPKMLEKSSVQDAAQVEQTEAAAIAHRGEAGHRASARSPPIATRICPGLILPH